MRYIIGNLVSASDSVEEETLRMRARHGNSRWSTMLLLLIITMIDSLAIFVAAESTDVVMTTTGPVQGEYLTTVNSVKYAAFKGMPYAKPPLGYLRFKPPVAIDPWTETLNATVDGSDCIQADSYTGAITGSEDCLFVNVHTTVTELAKTPTDLKPVMVWIYGGAFTRGTSSSETYRPDYLLEKGVVYAAFNYRIGALGFLSLNHPNATGNAGLKDQVLALKWLKANIAKFGGNPNNITIFGESAGAVSVGYHILSEASEGLFQAAISMSGVPLNPWGFHTPAKALSRAERLGNLLGTTTTDKEALLRTLYTATAEELVKKSSQMSLAFLPFVPTIEDKRIATDAFLTTCAISKYFSGNFTKVPQMLGFLNQESLTFATGIQPLIDIVNLAIDTLREYGLALPTGLSVVKSLLDTSSDVLDKLTDVTLQAIIDETTDLLFIAQIDQTQQLLSSKNNGKPIYYYHFSYYSNRSLHNIESNLTIVGAGHADDLAYVFYYPELNYSTDPTDPSRRTVDRVTTMWTNFAKFGDPTPNWMPDDTVKITWPNSGLLGRSLNIGTELNVELRPTNANTKLIQSTSVVLLPGINGCFPASFIPSKIIPSEIIPSKIIPSKIIPSKIIPSKIIPSKIIPSKIPNIFHIG